MTDELVGDLSAPENCSCNDTYERMVFPEPATMHRGISSSKSNENDKRTKALDPKKVTSLLPLFEHDALRKPRGGATVVHFASDIMVCPRIWCRQPLSRLLLQLVACKVHSGYTSQSGNVGELRTSHLVDIYCYILHVD
jgi:hypothetical protein